MVIRGILFDFDDTVVYSEQSRFESTNEVLREFNVQLSEDDWKNNFRSLGSLKMFDILKEQYKLEYSSEEMYSKAYENRSEIENKGVHLVEGVLDLFDELKKRNIKFIICSGGTTEHTTKILKQHNLEHIEHFGRECYEKRKPSPDAFLEGLKRLQLNSKEVLVFEDSFTGLQAGIAAGCRVIGVNTNSEEDVDSLGLLAKVKNFKEFDYSLLDK